MSGLFPFAIQKIEICSTLASEQSHVQYTLNNKTLTLELIHSYIPDIIVSPEAVDTMDLARVRRRRSRHRCRSVVTDFTVTALQPTVFYLELLYLQVMFSLRKSCLGIFLASF